MNNKTNFNEIIKKYNIKEELSLIKNLWDKYTSEYSENKLFYLKENYILSSCKYLNFQEEWIQETINTYKKINNNLIFKQFSWICHNILVNEKYNLNVIEQLKKIDDYTREDFPFFHVITFISGLNFIKENYNKKNIPETILLDTLNDINIWIRDYSKKVGKLQFDHIYWIIQHFHLRLFKIGRLQFQFNKFPFKNYCFKDTDNNVIILSEGNLKIRQDGQFDGANNIYDNNVWITQFQETDNHFTGNPVSPYGKIINKKIKLDKKKWELIAKLNDDVLAIHIPAAGTLTTELCNNSFKEAVDFFNKYYSEFNYSVFTCSSWLLDNQFNQYLKEESNIRKFSEEFYLCPIENANDSQTYDRVFGIKKRNIEELPQKSSLQKSMVEFLKSGGHFRSGGGIIFKDNFDFGNNIYIKYWNTLK